MHGYGNKLLCSPRVLAACSKVHGSCYSMDQVQQGAAEPTTGDSHSNVASKESGPTQGQPLPGTAPSKGCDKSSRVWLPSKQGPRHPWLQHAQQIHFVRSWHRCACSCSEWRSWWQSSLATGRGLLTWTDVHQCMWDLVSRELGWPLPQGKGQVASVGHMTGPDQSIGM